jgi:hypothetical protein
MFLLKLNPIEPPWYGPVCPVVWEGRHREGSPYPDQSAISVRMIRLRVAGVAPALCQAISTSAPRASRS